MITGSTISGQRRGRRRRRSSASARSTRRRPRTPLTTARRSPTRTISGNGAYRRRRRCSKYSDTTVTDSDDRREQGRTSPAAWAGSPATSTIDRSAISGNVGRRQRRGGIGVGKYGDAPALGLRASPGTTPTTAAASLIEPARATARSTGGARDEHDRAARRSPATRSTAPAAASRSRRLTTGETLRSATRRSPATMRQRGRRHLRRRHLRLRRRSTASSPQQLDGLGQLGGPRRRRLLRRALPAGRDPDAETPRRLDLGPAARSRSTTRRSPRTRRRERRRRHLPRLYYEYDPDDPRSDVRERDGPALEHDRRRQHGRRGAANDLGAGAEVDQPGGFALTNSLVETPGGRDGHPGPGRLEHPRRRPAARRPRRQRRPDPDAPARPRPARRSTPASATG